MDKKGDRRTRKTRQAIFTALQILLEKKPYAKITVEDIIDYADIGRTTFYSHFETKDVLLDRYLISVFDLIFKSSENSNDSLEFIPLDTVFFHLENHSNVLKGIILSEAGNLFFEKAKIYWLEKIASDPPRKSTFDNVPFELVSEYVVDSTIGVIRWWLKNEMPYSAEEMNMFCQKLIFNKLG